MNDTQEKIKALEARLALYLEAERVITTSTVKSYEIIDGDTKRSVTNLDLKMVTSTIRSLQSDIARLKRILNGKYSFTLGARW